MLIVVYDRNFGVTPADGLIEKSVKEWYDEGIRRVGTGDTSYKIWTASETVITAIRVLVKEKRFDYDKVKIFFENGGTEQFIPFDSDGRCETWPDGFCDTSLGLLSRLF